MLRHTYMIILAACLISLAAACTARAKPACCANHWGVCGHHCCDGTALPERCRYDCPECWWQREYTDYYRPRDVYPQDTIPLDQAHIFFNGLLIDTKAVLVNGRAMVPIRGIMQYLGAYVDYDDYTGEIVLFMDDRVVSLQIGRSAVYTPYQTYYLDVPPLIFNDHAYVPVRFFSEYFGAYVHWDGMNRVIKITM